MENHSRRVGVRATTMDRRVKIKEIRGGERREREKAVVAMCSLTASLWKQGCNPPKDPASAVTWSCCEP